MIPARRIGSPATVTYDLAVSRADALRRRGAYTEALHAFHALTLQYPQRSDAFSNLAAMLQATGHPMPALQAASRAIELDPANVSALLNSAEILKDFGDWQTVSATYDAALALSPDSSAIRFARALHLLMLGQWAEGWQEHEQRALVADLPLRRTPLHSPVWDGSPLEGRRILLDHEQGLGDQIMFARFAADVARRGGRVTIRCSPALEILFSSLEGVESISVEGTEVPPHDVHASLMSLPALLHLSSPGDVSGAPYLHPVGECPAALHRDAFSTRPRVGLVWAGNPQHRNDARRSLPPTLLVPIVRDADVDFVSLQRRETKQLVAEPLRDQVGDLGTALHTFNDTAHALTQLDLLVTVDTAVAHLAGALGVPTLLLVPFVPDWRWMTNRTDTPWYTSVQLIRQSTLFEWESVMQQVATRIESRSRAST